jgi:hypothetical protein
LLTAFRTKLSRYCGDVILDRSNRSMEPAGDAGIAEVFGKQAEHFQLPVGEPGRIGHGGRLRAFRDRLDAALAHRLSDTRSRAVRTNGIEYPQGLPLRIIIA